MTAADTKADTWPTDLLASATTAEPWARALENGLAKYGPTPIHDALVAELEAAS